MSVFGRTSEMEDYIDEMQALVIDIGSGMVKCGFSGDDAPVAVFPNIVGRSRMKNSFMGIGMNVKDCFVGDEAQAKRGILKLKYPLSVDRSPVNWYDLEKVYHHSFYNELSVTPEEHPLLLCGFHRMNEKAFEKIAQMFFETFNVPCLQLADQSVLSMMAAGILTGTTLNVGHGMVEAVSCYEGHPIFQAKIKAENPLEFENRVAGKSVTNYLVEILKERGYEMTTSGERELVRDIKEKLCYVAEDFDKEMELYEESQHCEHEYELPDGSKMNVGSERFRAPEILFKPSMVGSRCPNVTQVVTYSLMQAPSELQQEMSKNISVAGGSTMFEGFKDRFEKEIRKSSKFKDAHVTAIPERKYSSWIGGSILSSLSTFQKDWIFNRIYDEEGIRVMKRYATYCVVETGEEGFISFFHSNNVDSDLDERIQYVLEDEESLIPRKKMKVGSEEMIVALVLLV